MRRQAQTPATPCLIGSYEDAVVSLRNIMRKTGTYRQVSDKRKFVPIPAGLEPCKNSNHPSGRPPAGFQHLEVWLTFFTVRHCRTMQSIAETSKKQNPTDKVKTAKIERPRQDSNLQPLASEASALSNWATGTTRSIRYASGRCVKVLFQIVADRAAESLTETPCRL